MPRVPLIAAGATFVAGIAWAIRIVFEDTPWPSDAAALLSGCVVIWTAVAVIATLLSPARWVRMLDTTVGAAYAGLAVVLSVDAAWIVGVAATFVALVLVWHRSSDDWFAGTVRPDKVPARATAVPLTLLALPALIAIASTEPLSALSWTLAATAIIIAWAYARAFPTALWIVRIAVPVLAIATAFTLPLETALVTVLGAAIPTALSWTADARVAVQPLTPQKAEAVSILPEMVPSDLMRSAGLDPKGRPLPDKEQR